MSEENIVWHYENFLDIQFLVREKMEEENLDPSNPIHQVRIKEIITESVSLWRNWI